MRIDNRFCKLMLLSAVSLTLLPFASTSAAEPTTESHPAVMDTAPDFELTTLDGKPTRLTELAKQGPVVVILLRGYPGYQCPLCTKQAGEYLRKCEAFSAAKAQVLFIYPGPAAELKRRAEEFTAKLKLAPPFTFALDPDYKFTNAYHLRWDAPNETAYPSTFVIDQNRKVRYAVISKSHGGRSKAADVLKVLEEIKVSP